MNSIYFFKLRGQVRDVVKIKIKFIDQLFELLKFQLQRFEKNFYIQVDQTLRPLRMNTRLRMSSNSQNDDEDDPEFGEESEKISGYLRHIRQDIQKYLEIIDYKKIARETNSSKLNIEIINEKTVEIKKDENLTNHQWELYLQYLNQISEKITEIRKQYKFCKDDKRAQKINEVIEFQQFRHPVQEIINKFLTKQEHLKTENKTQNSEESLTIIKGEDGGDGQITSTNLKETKEMDFIFKIIMEHLKEMKKDFKDFKETRPIKKNLSQKDREKEELKQKQLDMKAMRKIFKKHRLLQNILETRSKRIRYLMVDLVNDPSLLQKKYEQMEKEVKEHEDKYSKLREILCLKSNKLIHVKFIKLYQNQILASKYREVFTKALDVVNYPYDYHKDLKNIWDFMNIEPQETYVNYFRTPKNLSFKKKSKLNQVWVNYEVTQCGRVSHFSNMERLKLVNLSVQKAVNLFYLQDKMYINQYFFMNDNYDLNGNTYKYIFNGCPLNEKELKKNQRLNNLRNFFVELERSEQKDVDIAKQLAGSLQNDMLQNEDNIKHLDQSDIFSRDAMVKSDIDGLDKSTLNFRQKHESEYFQTPFETVRNKKKSKILKSTQPQDQLQVALQEKVERLFVQKKTKNLKFEWSFQKSAPWFIPHKQIRDYYGEKVALYFSFLGYYTKSLMIIGFMGLGVFIIQHIQFFQNPSHNNYLNMGFGCMKIFWTTTTLYNWKRKEKLFATQYGQFTDKKDDEDRNVEDEERPGFDGIYMRSLVTDNMNSIYYPKFKRFLKILLTLITCFLMLSLYFAFVAAIFVVPQLLERYKDKAPFLSDDQYKVIVPGILNVFLYIAFNNAIYGSFSTVLTNFENHKSFIEYENNYVAKKFIFSFISLTGPLFMIAFFGQEVQNADNKVFRCSYADCYKHAQYHFATVFISLFSLNLFEILQPIFESKYKSFMKRRETAKLNQMTTPRSGLAKSVDKLSNTQLIPQKRDSILKGESIFMNFPDIEKKKFLEIVSKTRYYKLFNDSNFQKYTEEQKLTTNNYLKKDPFYLLNLYIQSESDKDQYSESSDIYGTVDEYLEICIQFSLLTMFGMMFPLSFSIAFIWNIIELLFKYRKQLNIKNVKTDKMKLMKYTQRPTPLGEGTIGSWLNLMDLASYMSILTNSGLITFLQSQIVVGDMPFRILNLMKRQEYILRSTVEVFKKVSNRDPDSQKNSGKDKDDDQYDDDDENHKKQNFNALDAEQLQISEEYEKRILKIRSMQIDKYKARPIFKIYNTIFKPKEQSELHDSMEQSFEILSSDDEDVVDKKKKPKEQAQSKQQNNDGIDKNTGFPIIWMKYKIYCRLGVIYRPILMKQSLVQQVQELSNKDELQTSMYLQYVKKINMKQLQEKVNKYKRKIFIFNIQGESGCWADTFRIVDNYQSTEQTLKFLFKLRNSDLNNDKLTLYDKIDVNINLITLKDIEKYFVPRGPKFSFSESYLRNSMYYKLLNSMQSINMKKLIIQKSPSEILQTPYFEEKLYQERLVWDLIKQRLMIDIYLPQNNNLVLDLDTAIPSYHFPQIQNWKIQRNKKDELMSFQTIKYDENINVPLFLLEETELTLRAISKQYYKSGDPEFYIAKQTLCFIHSESMFNFLTREQCYVVRMYNEKYITSLEDVVKMRRKGQQPHFYKEAELLGFLYQWLNNLEKFQTEYDLYHSNISPLTLILTMGSNTEYKLFNFQNLISGFEDHQIQRTITDEELIFIPPELITRFLSTKKKVEGEYINMFQVDLYSLCMVILYMATLGESLTEFLKMKDEIFFSNIQTEKKQKKQSTNESDDISKSSASASVSDLSSRSFFSKKSDMNLASPLTITNTAKKNTLLFNSSNLNTSIANKDNQMLKTNKDVIEKTFDPHLNEGQNVTRIIENYLNSQNADSVKEMYPILIFLIKKVILQTNPDQRPKRQELIQMISENTRIQFSEEQNIIRYCYSEFQQLCKMNSEQEKRVNSSVPINSHLKAILYNKLSLFSKTIDLLENYQFRIDNQQSFENITKQIDSQIQLSIGYVGCNEISRAIQLLDANIESISNKLSGVHGFGQSNDNYYKQSRFQMSSQFYQLDRNQLTSQQRDILNRFQNYSLYLKVYSELMQMKLNQTEIGSHVSVYEEPLRVLNIILQNIVNEDTKDKNTQEDITAYLQTKVLKLRLLIDVGLQKLYEQTFTKIFNELISVKSKLTKQEINKSLIDQFYFELVILESESLLSQSRYIDSLKIIEDYQKNTLRFKRISEFKDNYIDNNFKILKDQIILYALQCDLSIVSENMDSYQNSYQYVKRNFFGMITQSSFSFCFFYDLVEQLYHLIDLDSLKYDILQKMEKCLQYVYLNQYVPEKLDNSLNSFLDIRPCEEILFNPFIQFLIGKTFLGMESPRDREAGTLRFSIEDSSRKVQFQDDDLKIDMLSQNVSYELHNKSKDKSQQGIMGQFGYREKSFTNFSQLKDIGVGMDQSQMFTSTNQPQQQSQGISFYLKYNDLFMKQAEKLRMMIMTKSYFFQQRLIENILYCIDVEMNVGQMSIIESFNYLYRMRPQRKIPSIFFSSQDIERKKKEIKTFKNDKKLRNRDILAEHSDSIRFEAAYIHQYVEFMRKAQLFIQFKKYDNAIIQLKILSNIIGLYLKNYEKFKKNKIRKARKNIKIEQLLDENNIEELPLLKEKKEFLTRILMDQIFIYNHLALCLYGLKDYKMAKHYTFKLFKTESMDYLGPNYTIIRNIKGCVLLALDYRQLGIFQSSLMIIEIIDKVLSKVGHYPTVIKTRIVQDLQILKNMVLFEASQLELYYGFDEYKEQIQRNGMDSDKKGKNDDDEEAFIDEEKIKKRKSRPSIRSHNEFNIQEQINEEQYNKFKMRGFYLQKQTQSLFNLVKFPQIQQYKIQQIEITFLLSAVLLELGRYGKAHLQFQKVVEFDYNEFLEENIDNVSQFQFLYEKAEVRYIKTSFMHCQILMSMHLYSHAKIVIQELMDFSIDLLKTKKEKQEDENPYYKQIYFSISELINMMKSMKFIINCKLGETSNQKQELAELIALNTDLIRQKKKNDKFVKTLLLRQFISKFISSLKKQQNHLLIFIKSMSQMQDKQALESIRSSLKFLNNLMGSNKKKVKINDFKTNIPLKTLIDFGEIDEEIESKFSMNPTNTEMGTQKKIDPSKTLDFSESNIFENLISMDSNRCQLELLELELEQNIFQGNNLYGLYYKCKELLQSIMLKFLSTDAQIHGLIEYQKTIKLNKIQNFTNQVHNLFGSDMNGINHIDDIDENEIMKKYYSEKVDKEEEGYGLQGKVKVILKQFGIEVESKDKTLTKYDAQSIVLHDLNHCEELLRKIYSTNSDQTFGDNDDFAILHMLYGEYLLQMKDLLGSRKRYKQALKTYKQAHNSLVHPNVAIIYQKMAKMQDQIVLLIQQNIQYIVELEISSVLNKINADQLEFAIKMMIMMDESMFKVFYKYSLNRIVIFLVESIQQLKDQYQNKESNEDLQLLVHYEKSKQKENMEKEVQRITNTSREILEQILKEKREGQTNALDYQIIEDLYNKAQLEIIQSRRSIYGINIKFMLKDSEVLFENKKIKYLRLALMILKQVKCSHTDFFKVVELEYLNSLSNNLDYREEVDFLQYDIDHMKSQDIQAYNKQFGSDEKNENLEERSNQDNSQHNQDADETSDHIHEEQDMKTQLSLHKTNTNFQEKQ